MRFPLRSSLLLSAVLLAGCAAGSPNGGDVACTMEAKQCPDGSFVGREGPSCAFAACPAQESSDATGMLSVSDGVIAFTYDPAQFGLAVTPEQLLVSSYIPACDQGFGYCLYYNAKQYEGTNFESAGLGIVKRPNLADKQACLNAQPEGYDDLQPVVRESEGYATSMFAPLGDAGAGHYAHDRLYRLSTGASCYEFRTRIGATQFGNFPEGTIKEFTEADERVMQGELEMLVRGVMLKNGAKVVFP